MWALIRNAISEKTIEETLSLMKIEDAPYQDRHFRVEGKLAFLSTRGMRQLRVLTAEMAKVIDFDAIYDEPAVAHAMFLIKSSQGPATKLHQDRGYWVSIEARPTMSTFWIALQDIGPENGCLLLDPRNQVDAKDLVRFNDESQTLHPHERDHYGKEEVTSFAYVIASKDATRLATALEAVCCQRGDIVAFDSLEAHSSGPNHQKDRLAMKIAIGEAAEMNRHLIPLHLLLQTRPSVFGPVSTFYAVKERLRRVL